MTQKEALDILKSGDNVFITGAAGSGKTFVLNEYIKYLKQNNANIGITASTGIAATHMGGITIHSWIGMGVKDRLTRDDIEEIVEKQYLKNRLRDTDVLIIDEISMLHHFRLDMIDAILRRAKGKNNPFGGVQIVLAGDFFQLPPISKYSGEKSMFVYHSDSWKQAGFKISYLYEQYRQDSSDFISILNAIRENRIDDYVLDTLNSRLNKSRERDGFTKLYTHNIDVDRENNVELQKISNDIFSYHMYSKGNKNLVKILKKSILAPETLFLKEGAKVMFIKNNFDKGYVNGTLGVVSKCNDSVVQVKTLKGEVMDVERDSWKIEEDGDIKAEVSQYPLRLAWAITIHKSQGMSLDSAIIDLSNSFESGMGYVALSRLRNLEGLFLKGINDTALSVNKEVLSFDRYFREESDKLSDYLAFMGIDKINQKHEDFVEHISKKNKNKKEKIDTVLTTKALLLQEISIKEIALLRRLKEETVISHIEKILEKEPNFNIKFLQKEISRSRFEKIISAFRKIGVHEGGKRPLSPVKKILGPSYSFNEIRLARLFL